MPELDWMYDCWPSCSGLSNVLRPLLHSSGTGGRLHVAPKLAWLPDKSHCVVQRSDVVALGLRRQPTFDCRSAIRLCCTVLTVWSLRGRFKLCLHEPLLN